MNLLSAGCLDPSGRLQALQHGIDCMPASQPLQCSFPRASYEVCKWTKAEHWSRGQHIDHSPESPVHLKGCSHCSNQRSGIHQNSPMQALGMAVVLIPLALSVSLSFFYQWNQQGSFLPGSWLTQDFHRIKYSAEKGTRVERFFCFTFHSAEYLPFLTFFVNLAVWTLGNKEAMTQHHVYNLLLLIAREGF